MMVARLANAFFRCSRSRYFSGMIAMARTSLRRIARRRRERIPPTCNFCLPAGAVFSESQIDDFVMAITSAEAIGLASSPPFLVTGLVEGGLSWEIIRGIPANSMGGSRQMPSSVRCLRLECWRWPWRVSTLRHDPTGRPNSQLLLPRNKPSQASAALAPKGLGVANLLMVAGLTAFAECWPFGALGMP